MSVYRRIPYPFWCRNGEKYIDVRAFSYNLDRWPGLKEVVNQFIEEAKVEMYEVEFQYSKKMFESFKESEYSDPAFDGLEASFPSEYYRHMFGHISDLAVLLNEGFEICW